ncbi:hypothetical protein H9647_25265, partial [Paenibacillus sp. Sa2BVA9]|nr:hypothetical protein [Paenibacillus gallinarum]
MVVSGSVLSFRKVLIVLLIFTVLFYTTVIPQPKAQANPAVALALGAEI